MNDKLHSIVDYLSVKIKSINVNNPKSNTGGVILALHPRIDEDLPKLVNIAMHTIQLGFTKDTTESPAGTVKLTFVSTKIGELVSKILDRELPWHMQIKLGDLFIEGFFKGGFIEIYYPKVRNASHVVSATIKWGELAELSNGQRRATLYATTTERPADITGMTQLVNGVKYPVVKNKTDQDAIDLDTPFVRAINTLQQTGWKINRRVLDAIKGNSELFIDEISEDDPNSQKRHCSQKVEWDFIIGKAEALRDESSFYQFVDTDYRGRFYYPEAFLNFQGSDTARSMMKFSHGKPMTESGIRWLAIHLASSYNESFHKDDLPEWLSTDYLPYLEEQDLDNISVDKMTLEDRAIWTEQHMADILECGKNGTIIVDAEKKVATLAACIEFYDYHIATKANRLHISFLPIPIDGSNNGWQHLGAISKDSQTGELVGLVPSEIQKDFYVQTAKKLIDLTTDPRIADLLATMSMKHIRKGISKRGSMTRAYSAGAKKIAENMFADCAQMGFTKKYGITQDDCMKISSTLVKAIKIVCPGPLETMDYLQKLATFQLGKFDKVDADGNKAGKEFTALKKAQRALFAKRDKTEEEMQELNDMVQKMQTYTSKRVYGRGEDRLQWTTPSGFAVDYTCFVTERKKTRGTINGYSNVEGAKTNAHINHVAQIATKQPDYNGFMCGVSPNFIHSLDASHMSLVIDDWSGSFGAVHDSFSAHASDVDVLLEKTKEKFIEIYDVDNFYNYIQSELVEDPTDLDVTQPQRGELDVARIKCSDYFFC